MKLENAHEFPKHMDMRKHLAWLIFNTLPSWIPNYEYMHMLFEIFIMISRV